MTPSEHKDQLRAFRVGVLTIATLGVLGALIVSIGSSQGAFTRKVRYQTYFKNIGGLTDSAPVKLSGVPVGRVSDITFTEDVSRTDIRIEIQVDRRKANRIRAGTTAQLKALSLLSGEKYVELTPGDPTKAELEHGATIPSVQQAGDLSEIGGAATDVAAEVVKIADNLNKILVSINEGQGILGKAVADPDFGKETLDAIQRSLELIRDLLTKVNQGEGLAGRLLVDEAYGDRLTGELEGTIVAMRSILEKVDRGEGTAAQLVNDPDAGKRLLSNLTESTESLKQLLAEVRSGEGLAGKLLFDRAYADQVSADIAETVANLKSISAKMDRGDGSVAKLVNDPALYASLNDIVSGVQRSKIIGMLLRRYQKKGIQARTREAVETMDPAAAEEHLEGVYGEPLDPPPPK